MSGTTSTYAFHERVFPPQGLHNRYKRFQIAGMVKIGLEYGKGDVKRSEVAGRFMVTWLHGPEVISDTARLMFVGRKKTTLPPPSVHTHTSKLENRYGLCYLSISCMFFSSVVVIDFRSILSRFSILDICNGLACTAAQMMRGTRSKILCRV